MEDKILIIQKGTLDDETRTHLIEKGYLVIEVPDPSKVSLYLPATDAIPANDLLMSALAAANDSMTSREKFLKELLRRLTLKEPQK